MRNSHLRNGLLTALTLILALLIVIPVLAAPADLDTTWGGTGMVTTDLDGAGDTYQGLEKLLPYPGDKVIGLAHYIDAPSQFVLVRYNNDGTLDNTFSGDGVFIIPRTPNGPSQDDTSADMVIQSDGKIVVVGNTYPSPGGVVHIGGVRVNANGTVDTSFDSDGYLDIDATNLELSLSGKSSYTSSVTLQPADNKIIITGGMSRTDYDGAGMVMRLNTDGSRDNSFGSNGIVAFDYVAGDAQDNVVDAVVQPDGKIVIASNSESDASQNGVNYDFVAARFNADGTLDTSFDGDGKAGVDVSSVEFSISNEQDSASGLVLQPDGKIVLAGGATNDTVNYAGDVTLVRFNANGSRDNSFGGNGIVTTAINNRDDWANAIALQENGKFVVVGTADKPDSGANDSMIVRYNSDGTLDNTFSDDGKLTFNFGSSSEFGHDVAIQPDGKILAVVTNGLPYPGGDVLFSVRLEGDPVGPANTAPELTNITNKTVDEGDLLSFTATATDADDPAQTLTFSLEAGFPTGAAITAGGNFTWTPSEAQGPGVYPITVKVTDNGTGNLSDTDSFNVTVNEINTAPVLANITNKTVDEGTLLSFTATATDSDLPANTLTYTLEAGFPTGAAITTGGDFTWTPSEAQGPGTYTITVRVSDGDLSDTDPFNVTVNEVNTPPVLASIDDIAVDEGTLLSFSASATDGDLPAQTLTYTLEAGFPTGAAITTGGAFTWTPSEAQGPGIYPITVKVTDNGAGNLTDTEDFTVTVNETNTAPVLANITDKTVDELTLLSFTATATDSDNPAQTLTFSLEAGFPTGAAITTGGDFTWTPDETQGPGTYPITVKVTDNGTPNLSHTDSFNVTVNEVNIAPDLADITDKTVDELTLLSFSATATDADLPANTLTFSLEAGSPSGAVITTGGAFTWTPSEAQGPGTYSITVRVTDSGTGNLSDTDSFNVTVNEVNTAPDLADITDKTVDELTLLSFTATATDGDLPANTLTYTLEAGAPTGAAITTGGDFTWTPDETQGPGMYPITVRVTDGAISDTDSFNVTVNEVNTAPVLADITDKTVNEGELLSFTAIATDGDLPANTLSFSLEAGAPTGAAITTGGDFTWTPSEAQGPGTYSITVRVTDSGTPAQSATDSFNVTVDEVNVLPAINPIASPIAADEGVQLSFTVTGTDTDLPAQTLTYSLGATAPTGVNINPTTGLFTWTPDETQGGGSYTFDLMVTDNGTPILSATQSITINVSEVNIAPELDPIGNKEVNELALLTFTASASDDDDPTNTLTYSLDTPTPGNAAIDPVSGVFTWTPDDVTATTTYNISVRVTDNGTPALSDFELISVVVRNPSDVFELANPGFEEQGVNQKDALNWNETELTTTDRRICNTTTPLKVYSHTGECAFRLQYSGITNLERKLAQSMALPSVIVGDTVRLDFWAKANDLTNGVKVQLRLNYTDGTNDLINLPMPNGTYDYTAFDIELPVTKALTNVRVMVFAGTSNGSVLFDDLTITRIVGAPLTMQRNGENSLIPVPAAPGDLRGGGSVGGQ